MILYEITDGDVAFWLSLMMRFVYVFDNQYIIKHILKFAKMVAR